MVSLNPPNYAYMRDGRNVSLAESVPAEIMHMVDPYWYQWPPMEPMWFGIIGFVIAILGIMSLSGNFIVMYIFTSSKGLRTPSNMFVVNLAFSDFMMMFTMFPPVVLNGFYGTWVNWSPVPTGSCSRDPNMDLPKWPPTKEATSMNPSSSTCPSK